MQTPAIDPASLRLYYLQQLGISVYVSRGSEAVQALSVPDPVPVAADAAAVAPVNTRAMDVRSADVRSADVRPMEEAQVLPASVTPPDYRSALQSLKEDSVPPARRETPPVSAAPAAPASVSEEAAPFQLLFGFSGTGVGLAVQIPLLAKGRLDDAGLRLLGNLLRWLGLPVPSAWLQFRWPLPGMSAGTAAQAGKSLGLFVEQATSNQQLQHLLVLGAGPAQALAAASDSMQCRVWATHGLAEMLAVPPLKREVWQALLPLQTLLGQR